MAPADQLAPAGSSSYTSDTLNVGDGTWDFTKNDFLLPNLVGLNFDTMRYNGMGNRFSTVAQYHTLIKGHAAIGIITFLFIIPISVMIVRFHSNRTGAAVRYHAYLNVIAVLLATVVLVTGWFAVGPHRSLTNPHHGIGVAIYTLVLLQIIGGRLVRHLAGRHSLRLSIHRWFGSAIAILGIVQVPLGLTLYGSPKALFVLYTLWMTFLLFVYFILNHRHEGRLRRDGYYDGGRPNTPAKSGGGALRWLGPLAAGAGAWALWRRHKRDQSPDRSRRQSRSRVGSRSRSRSYGRHEVLSSRRGSDSFVEDEKFNANRRKDSNGGFMNKLLAAGAAAGAGALLTNFISNRRKKNRDEEYSAVATDTPSHPGRTGRLSRPPPRRNTVPISNASDFTEDSRTNITGSPVRHHHHHGSMGAAAAGAAAGAAAASVGNAYRHSSSGNNNNNRPVTPRPSHQRTHSMHDPVDGSDYSSYQSPSRRTPPASGRMASAGKGLLGGMGLGWLASRFGRRNDTAAQENERMRREEEDRRAGTHGQQRYTGDGYGSPVRRDRYGRRPPPSHAQSYSEVSESIIEQGGSRPYAPVAGAAAAGAAGAAGGAAYAPVTPVANPRRSHSMSRPRPDVEPVTMPEMPPESDSDSILPQGRVQRSSSRRRREAERLAAGAVAGTAAGAMGRSNSRRRDEDSRYAAYPPPANQPPVSVKVKVPHDRAGNITLRRLTEAEAAAERGSSQQRRPHPSDDASSLSGTDSPSNRRYRRESSVRPAELSAEQRTEGSIPPPAAPPYQGPPHSSSGVLNPPNPPFAGGRRPKDSAYFSGAQGPPGTAAGPSGSNPTAGHTMTSIESRGSHGTWGAMSPSPGAGGGGSQPPDVASSAAAERRRRRRLERNDGRPQAKVDYQ
ncbi:kinetochore protein NNF1 [Sporothrix schenckii 1099-18]|uniref:Kinetochore protein NNF1 n=1 Tax=Sporothrix schenckii 1099-18 TaxID=1397361 RepID=A0A0F2LWZ2_SPOSC|nr:kinetochore protein NNF1 [Sporothrix schenckii 1099-18]KJR81005.1 kinetochore protein NNF1 [Sporothrix schenckii 1099-18]